MGLRRKDTPMRECRQRSDSKLTREQIMAAHRLYKAGWSVPEIAAQIWEANGYLSQRACQNSLYYAFSSYKLRTRNAGQARWLRQAECVGCGVKHDHRTTGCTSCNSRWYWRRKVEQAYRRLHKLCLGCGCTIEERTRGCRTCSERHSKRSRRLTELPAT